MTKRVLLSLAVCCFFVLSPIRAVSAGEPAGAVRDAGADGLIDCGPGSEDTVWRIGDVTARVTCPTSAAGDFASASLCLSSGGQAPSCVRVYPGPCRIVRGHAGGIPFYSVESSPASGPERRSLSLVFPGGTVMPVFDELKASHGSPVSLGNKVRLEWSCEYAEALPVRIPSFSTNCRRRDRFFPGAGSGPLRPAIRAGKRQTRMPSPCVS